MKKSILFIFVSLLLVACSGDDDGSGTPREIGGIVNATFDTDKMIGTWTYETITLNGNESAYEHVADCPKDIFTFYNSPGRSFQYEEMVRINDQCGTQTTALKWEVNRDLINFYFGQQFIIAFRVLSITDTEFILSYRFDYDQDGDLDDVEIIGVKSDTAD